MNVLYTNRLILRPFREDDAAAVFKNWTQDERVAEHCRWYPHKRIEETKEYLNLCLNAEYCWAITLIDQDEPIGCIDLVGKNSAGVYEIGYVLMFDHWGKGIMTEAVDAVIKELFDNGYEVIGAHHKTDNPASGKVMEKCGMSYVKTTMVQKKFGSDELCEVRCYEIHKKSKQ